MKIIITIVIAFLVIVYVFTFLKWRKRKKKGINSVAAFNKRYRYIEKASLKTRKTTELDKSKATRPNVSAIDYIEKETFFKE